MPLAELLVRHVNGKSAVERHHCAFYLGEAALRLVGAAAVGSWRVASEPAEELRPRVAELRRASMGQWVGWVRDAQRLHPGFALDFTQGSIEASVAWAEALQKHEVLDRSVVRSMRKRGTLGFFEALVTYRNAVLGHGAQRVRSFYEEVTPLLVAAVLEHIESIPWLAQGQLVGRDAEGACHRLAGLAALPTEPFEAEEGLYVSGGDVLVPLAPFVRATVDDALDRQRIVFLNRVVVRRSTVARAEYLDYATGEGVELDPEPLRGLLDSTGASDDTLEERVDDYELGEVLGVGAMGIVRRATQVGLGRPVALKSLSDALALDPTARHRFEREVKALARCDHPNVVKVLAAGEREGTPYYAMELVEGQDLRNHEGPAPSFEAWMELFAGAAEGLDHLHQHGIVHRDIKPANLMLTADQSRLVVMDLGLARLEDASVALTVSDSGLIGTLRYMAPEQLTGNSSSVDGRADVYGLAVTLYEQLTGGRFFDGDSRERLMHQILHERPVPPSQRNAALPPGIDRVMAMATALRPDERYQDAAAFAADLRRLARGDTIAAPVVSRSPRWIAGAAVAGVALIGLFAVVALMRPTPPDHPMAEPVPASDPAGLLTEPPPGPGLPSSREPEPVSVEPSSPEPVADPSHAPPEPGDAAPSPEPARPEPPAPSPVPSPVAPGPSAPAPSPVPIPSPAAPDPEPAEPEVPDPVPEPAPVEPEAPRIGNVRLVGDVPIELRVGSARLPPGPVPPARYRVYATFKEGDAPTDSSLEVDVRDGSTTTVRCNPVHWTCEIVR